MKWPTFTDTSPNEKYTFNTKATDNRPLRALILIGLLFMAALGGKRGKNPLRDFYEGMVGRGKMRMVALIAAARKILLWAWAVFRSHTYFDPSKCAPKRLTN